MEINEIGSVSEDRDAMCIYCQVHVSGDDRKPSQGPLRACDMAVRWRRDCIMAGGSCYRNQQTEVKILCCAVEIRSNKDGLLVRMKVRKLFLLILKRGVNVLKD